MNPSPAVPFGPCRDCGRDYKLMPSGLCAWCHHAAVSATEPQPEIEPFSPPTDEDGDDDTQSNSK